MRTVSTTATEAMMSPQTGEVFLVILEITHPDLPTPIRVVNNTQSVTSNTNEYLPTAFSFILPAQEDGKIGNSGLTIDNVDRTIVKTIREIKDFPSVTASVILASDPDVIEAGPFEFQLRGVSYTRNTVSGDLIYESHMLDNLGTIRYKNLTFPGLFE